MIKILIIEDNPFIRDNLEEYLHLFDFDIITAGDGVEGLECIGETKPDLILCDLAMPRMDGFELMKVVKKNPVMADIPIIVITSSAENKERNSSLNAGATGYLVKPFSSEALLAIIDKHTAGLVWQHLPKYQHEKDPAY